MLLGTIIVLYFIQLIVAVAGLSETGNTFLGHDMTVYKTKKEFFLDLIPFYMPYKYFKNKLSKLK